MSLDRIYAQDFLQERQLTYPKFFRGVFDEKILPILTADEANLVKNLRFVFPLTAPGAEPFGFHCSDHTISLSVASLKLLNDLLLAYSWLGCHKYQLITIDEYLLVLASGGFGANTPQPLPALGIPDNAADEPAVGDCHLCYVRSAYLFLLLHELGHLIHDDPHASAGSAPQAQAEEARADQFALRMLARLSLMPLGIAQFFSWATAFAPNRYLCPDEETYQRLIRAQKHPMSTRRLSEVANDIRTNAANFVVNQETETLQAFDALANELENLALLKDDRLNQKTAAERARCLVFGNLAPRPSAG